MSFLLAALSTAVVLGTPLLLAATGELIAERAGVMNLGIEGMMLVGAALGFAVADTTGSIPLAVAAAAGAGGALALVHAALCVSLGANQVVAGLTLALLGGGLSAFVGADFAGIPLAATVAPVAVPVLHGIPGLGPVLFEQDVFVYAAFVAVGLTALLLARTRAGQWLRATGEAPAAADTAGVPVALVRYCAVVTGGIFAGVAGSYFSTVYVRLWSDNLTAGRGWVALALVIFASWRPLLLIPGALLFGVIDSLNFQLQTEGVGVSSDVLGMMPYAFTLIALALVWTRQRHRGMPRALGQPYEREARGPG